MSHQIIYTTIGILTILSIALFAGGYAYLQQGELPSIPKTEVIADSFPFGEGGTARENTSRAPITAPQQREITPKEIISTSGALRQISAKSVAGATIFLRENIPTVRYIERQTGHIYELKKEARSPERITNTTIPKIQYARWGNNNDTVVLQYLDDNDTIKTFSAKIMQEGGTIGTLKGSFLPDNTYEFSISPDTERLFYIFRIANDAVGTVANIDGSAKKQIFDSPVTEWLPHWVDKNTIMLATKPTATANGFLYTLNATTGLINKVFGDVRGLTALSSKNKKKVLFSASTKNSFETFIYDVARGTLLSFPITTFPEKCAWGNDNITLYCGAPDSIPPLAYPDAWYQGITSFSDTIWKIDTETGALDILATPKDDVRTEIDFIHPLLSPNEGILIFMNKKDSSLWSLQLRP
ncbi:MAG: hypothetical protein Q8R36_00945 [bacterium]|nr:hypothetical protein [bacterium]